MNIDRISLTPEQASWFARNILKTLKLLESSERKNPGVKERATYRTMLSMKEDAERAGMIVEAFGEEELYEIDVMLSPKQRKVLKDLIGSVHKGLVEQVIPKYEGKLGDASMDYQKYLDNARNKAAKLEQMLRKVR